MTLKTVEWCSFTKLSCTYARDKTVILCLNSSDLVAPISCPSPSEDDYTYSFIEATICQGFNGNPSNCGTTLWSYIFQYNTDELADGVTSITSSDILSAFCKDCSVTWTEQLIGDECFIRTEEDDSQTFVSQHGCEYPLNSGGGGGSGWLITGNSGTVDGTNFLGTTDNVAFDIRVNNLRAFRFQPAAAAGASRSPDIIGGHNLNSINVPGFGCAILSGGRVAGLNQIIGANDAATICGGQNNVIRNTSGSADISIICGGINNIIDSDQETVICGGEDNECDFGVTNFIGGGNFNIIGGASPDGGADSCVIVGGEGNSILGFPFASSIVGGEQNSITNTLFDAVDSFIGGGSTNNIDAEESSAIVCGENNSITGGGVSSFIGAGSLNNIISDASNDNMSILGGEQNVITTSNRACILGGHSNFLTNADHSSILGGGQLTLGANSVGFQADPGVNVQRDTSAFSSLAYFGDVDIWVANTNSTATKVKFFEPNADLDFSSTNYSSFAAQAQGANIDYIWPAAAGTAGQQLTIDTVVGTVVTLKWA